MFFVLRFDYYCIGMVSFCSSCRLFLLVGLACVVAADSLNLRPIIGVVSEPISPEAALANGLDANRSSYIAASYVKYLEMAGARVVPLKYNAPTEELDGLLQGRYCLKRCNYMPSYK